MRVVCLILLILGLSNLAKADYFAWYSQVSVHPELGSITISREQVWTEKRVEWMYEHRKALASRGIHVDAEPGEGPLVLVQKFKLDGQEFEITITSDHRSRMGPGSAGPDVHLSIKVNGMLRWDTTFGDFRDRYNLQKLVIHPAEKMITFIGARWDWDDFEWEQHPDPTVFYDLEPDGKVHRSWSGWQ